MSWKRLWCSRGLARTIRRTAQDDWARLSLTLVDRSSLITSKYSSRARSRCVRYSTTQKPTCIRCCNRWKTPIRSMHADSNPSNSNNGVVVPQPLLRVVSTVGSSRKTTFLNWFCLRLSTRRGSTYKDCTSPKVNAYNVVMTTEEGTPLGNTCSIQYSDRGFAIQCSYVHLVTFLVITNAKKTTTTESPLYK